MYRYFVFILKIYKLKFEDRKETDLNYIKKIIIFLTALTQNKKKTIKYLYS